MLLEKNATYSSTHFQKFKIAVSKRVFNNLSFNLIVDGKEHTTFDSFCEQKITNFIRDILKKLPTPIIQAINALDEEKKFQELVDKVAGTGKRDPQVCFANGKGLHFSGLTKLCYDVSHHHPKTSRYPKGFPTLLHINEVSLFKIKNPLNIVNTVLEEFCF